MLDWTALEATIRRDPAGRGLASFNDADGPLLIGHLENAARDLAEGRGWAAIVTGFAIRTEAGPIAETDGPPGAIYLKQMLEASGMKTRLVSDPIGEPVIDAGMYPVDLGWYEYRRNCQSHCNDDNGRIGIRRWWRKDIAGPWPGLNASPAYLIAIERSGPSHTLESVEAESREEFKRVVPPHERDVCHNMRGVSLDDVTAPFNVMFEYNEPQDGPIPRTIGILDGGNEIGSGNVPWSVLRRAIAQGSASSEHAATIPCRIRTDHAILAGVSNWGAYALGAAVAVLRGRRDVVEAWTAERQQGLIEAMVRDGGAVDGVTKRREATVDGLALNDYLAVFEEIRRIALG